MRKCEKLSSSSYQNCEILKLLSLEVLVLMGLATIAGLLRIPQLLLPETVLFV